MRTSPAAMITFVALGIAAGATWRRAGCEAPSRDAPAFPFSMAELSHVPKTWYCISPWTKDHDDERRGMELFAWRLFVAINWPGKVGAGGKWEPGADVSGLNKPDTYPRWAGWHTPKSLYELLKNCETLAAPRASWSCDGRCVAPWLEGDGYDIAGTKSHACVFDQKGQLVHYEVRLAQKSLVASLHSILCPTECPDAPAPSFTDFSFTYGQCEGQDNNDIDGSIAVKLAWKVLSDDEKKSGRFLQRTARVSSTCSPDGGEVVDATLGLVAFHVTQKTLLHRWIWATFEHVNNLVPGEGEKVASFNDPGCRDCPPNTTQRRTGSVCKTQVTRTTPIPKDVVALNDVARTWLEANGSVLRHYQLVDVQFDPRGVDGKDFEPRELRNPLVETYHVVGRPTTSATECGPEPDSVSTGASCQGCHRRALIDSSFVIQSALCNCDDPRRWIGNDDCGADKCEKLGIRCASPAPP